MNRIFVWADRYSVEEHNLIRLFSEMKIKPHCYLGGIVSANVNAYYFETESKSVADRFMKNAMKKKNKAYKKILCDDCNVYDDQKKR